MNAKIEKVTREISRTKDRISEQQAKLRDLEKQKTELENTEIVETVRGMEISFADLATLLQSMKSTSRQNNPKSTPKQNAKKGTLTITETDDDVDSDTEDEDEEEEANAS